MNQLRQKLSDEKCAYYILDIKDTHCENRNCKGLDNFCDNYLTFNEFKKNIRGLKECVKNGN